LTWQGRTVDEKTPVTGKTPSEGREREWKGHNILINYVSPERPVA